MSYLPHGKVRAPFPGRFPEQVTWSLPSFLEGWCTQNVCYCHHFRDKGPATQCHSISVTSHSTGIIIKSAGLQN